MRFFGLTERLVTSLRAFYRGTVLLLLFFFAFVDYALRAPWLTSRPRLRADWMHRWSRRTCGLLNLDIQTRGSIPLAGLLVCNHLSYLDGIALSSLTPSVFVVKSEVAGWPLFGLLARLAGTVFVDRRRRFATNGVLHQVQTRIDNGDLVVLFPEGTSTNGSSVLPFKSSLLEPVAQLRCDAFAAALHYSLPGGSAAEEICYWRDMEFLPHLIHLLGRRQIHLFIGISGPVSPSGDRKEIALRLREHVVALYDGVSGSRIHSVSLGASSERDCHGEP